VINTAIQLKAEECDTYDTLCGLLCCRTDVEPDAVSEETTAEAETTLRERRPTSTNNDELLELTRITRNTRRAWIADRQPTITEIFVLSTTD